jgi:hypothetical protein
MSRVVLSLSYPPPSPQREGNIALRNTKRHSGKKKKQTNGKDKNVLKKEK